MATTTTWSDASIQAAKERSLSEREGSLNTTTTRRQGGTELELVGALSEASDEIVHQASLALERAHRTHYDMMEPELLAERLRDLLAVVLDCLSRRTLSPICMHAQEVAAERFAGGFDIAEVQTAFNVLEEAIWRVVIPRRPGSELVEATGLIGTVLGAGKDTLACTWVSLASQQHVPSLNLAALFEGAGS